MKHQRKVGAQGSPLLIALPADMEDLVDDLCTAVAAHLDPPLSVRGGDPWIAPPPDAVVNAPRAIRNAGWGRGTIAVTAARLHTSFLEDAAGWTDRRRGVSIVSVHDLDLVGARDHGRLAKLVAHEASHLLGLPHCRRPGCLNLPSRRREDLDALSGFCPRCRQRLVRAASRRARRAPDSGQRRAGD